MNDNSITESKINLFLKSIFDSKHNQINVSDCNFGFLFINKKEDEVDTRNNFVICLVGHNRTGKTTKMREMAVIWKSSRPGRRVFAFDPQNKFDGIADIIMKPHELEFIPDTLLSLRNSLIIFDDYRLLIGTRSTQPKWLETLMSQREEWNVDIIYACHSPALVINFMSYYTTKYYMYFTLAASGTFDKKIPNYQFLITAKNLINMYVKKEGKGQYPLFPHIIVDIQNDEMTAININKDKFVTLKNEEYTEI